jgi:hypothetical protein
MKHLLICDNTSPEKIVELCRSWQCGIEAQAFFHYEALSSESLIAETRGQIRDLPLIAMHGPFGDLNAGSFDPLIREGYWPRALQLSHISRGVDRDSWR